MPSSTIANTQHKTRGARIAQLMRVLLRTVAWGKTLRAKETWNSCHGQTFTRAGCPHLSTRVDVASVVRTCEESLCDIAH